MGDIREIIRVLRNSSDYCLLYINLLFKFVISIYFLYFIFLKVVIYMSKIVGCEWVKEMFEVFFIVLLKIIFFEIFMWVRK